jgi:hypothetical protein
MLSSLGKMGKSIFDKVNLTAIILLFVWLSFFPVPIQQKYHLATKVFLTICFLFLLLKKGISIFKLSNLPLWLFLVTIGINVFFAQEKDIALRTYWDLAIPMFLIYYIVSQNLSSKKAFNFLARIICISSIIISLGAILESLFAFNPIYEYFIENPYYKRYISGFVRPMSTQFNPTALGSYLLGCLPFNYFLFKRDKSFFRLLSAIGIVLSSVTVILIFSWCAFAGLITIVAFYLFLQKEYRKTVIVCLLILFLIFSLLIWRTAKSRFGSKWAFRDGTLYIYSPAPLNIAELKNLTNFVIDYRIASEILFTLFTYRLIRFNMAMHIIKDHPFVGLGLQHFRIRFYEYYPYKRRISPEIMIADNMYLTILSETGIIGFLGFFIFIFSLLKKGWRRLIVLDAGSNKRWYLLISMMAFIGLLVNMAGYEFFYWPNQYLLFCLIIGCIAASLR